MKKSKGSGLFTIFPTSIMLRRTAHNKIYLLRSLRCCSSSGARPLRHQDRGQGASGTLVLRLAASGSGHILTCREDTASQNVR
jgi:hypothetical protein